MMGKIPAMLDVVVGARRGGRMVVLGDIMLDRHLWGRVERLSPEAPVPVVRLAREVEAPGVLRMWP